MLLNALYTNNETRACVSRAKRDMAFKSSFSHSRTGSSSTFSIKSTDQLGRAIVNQTHGTSRAVSSTDDELNVYFESASSLVARRLPAPNRPGQLTPIDVIDGPD